MTVAAITPWPLVRKGDTDHPLRTLQHLLRARGHDVTVDGGFGPMTDAAVRSVQDDEGLAVEAGTSAGAHRTWYWRGGPARSSRARRRWRRQRSAAR